MSPNWIIFLSLLQFSAGLNLLGVFVYPSFKQWTVYNALITELSQRGHNLTVITNYPTTETTSNYREVHVKPFYSPDIEIGEKYQLKNVSEIPRLDRRQSIDIRFEMGLSATQHFLASRTVKEFVDRVRTEKVTYDVMLVGDYYQEACLYLAELMNCPVVGVNPEAVSQITSHYYLGLGDKNLLRFHDLLEENEGEKPVDSSLAEYANKKYLKEYLPRQREIIKESFGFSDEDSNSFVDFEALHKRILFILSNSYPFFQPPSPVVAGKEILIGGFYIRPPKELSRDIKDFLHDANYGAIFVTLPSQVYGVHLDMEIINRLMIAFGGLRQKILFEWDGAKVVDPPKNVFFRKWIPISDILAHPYVQLMICSGDIWCVQNAIQRMVPLIGIPFTKEQDLLLKTVARSGYGHRLSLEEVTSDRVRNITKEMFGNQALIKRIHDEAKFYRNRPLGAMEEAVYWVEFAGNYKADRRIYRQPLNFSSSGIIPSSFSKIITILGSILVIIVLCCGAFVAYRTFFKATPGKKRDKKAV